MVVVPPGEVGAELVHDAAAQRDPWLIVGSPPHGMSAMTASGVPPPPGARLDDHGSTVCRGATADTRHQRALAGREAHRGPVTPAGGSTSRSSCEPMATNR